MDSKELYNEKLLTLATMQGHIEKLRICLTDLSTLEERFPDPDPSEFYVIGTALDELDSEVSDLAAAVKPLVQSR